MTHFASPAVPLDSPVPSYVCTLGFTLFMDFSFPSFVLLSPGFPPFHVVVSLYSAWILSKMCYWQIQCNFRDPNQYRVINSQKQSGFLAHPVVTYHFAVYIQTTSTSVLHHVLQCLFKADCSAILRGLSFLWSNCLHCWCYYCQCSRALWSRLNAADRTVAVNVNVSSVILVLCVVLCLGRQTLMGQFAFSDVLSQNLSCHYYVNVLYCYFGFVMK